ncbi:hypothetical protein DFH28DRAFT_534759 [Melampsora americana]|nr:hypothetical protein DFH28DRAFT_534759 [Melampsora americana]
MKKNFIYLTTTGKRNQLEHFFTMKDDRLSKIFAIRMKSLASLADKMNIEFPQTHQIEENYSEKIISTGECLIAQHVGLSIELLRKFKIWLNFKEPKDKLKSRTIGNWENVPIEFTRKGHLFKEYFELRLEKVRGLENWYRECKKILVFEDVQ